MQYGPFSDFLRQLYAQLHQPRLIKNIGIGTNEIVFDFMNTTVFLHAQGEPRRFDPLQLSTGDITTDDAIKKIRILHRENCKLTELDNFGNDRFGVE